MRKHVVAGNWKMNGNKVSVHEWLQSFKSECPSHEGVDVIIFPPFVFLDAFQRELEGSSLAFGAQNLSEQVSGAYTGEISAQMLIEFGCRYVLVGHSERRQLYGENHTQVAEKFIQARKNGLIPILCVGETLEQRKQNQTETILQQQIESILGLPEGVALFDQALIAYEPVWAIGTGETATPDQAQRVHVGIREKISELSVEIAEKLPILYGGSVKASNASELFAMPDIDGGLVGGASLQAKEFGEIVQCIK